MKRLFIAINLPEETKNKIEEIVNDLKISVNQRIDQLESVAEIKFLPKENWHLTISFLGYQPDEKIPNILESIKTTTQSLVSLKRPILIEFERIILAPPGRTPRMIWLVGSKETSKILGTIKTKLEDELIKNGVRFKRENREYNTHLTLARFQSIFGTSDVPNMDIRRPKIENISFIAQSLDLMESHLKRTGAEYEILSTLTFLPK